MSRVYFISILFLAVACQPSEIEPDDVASFILDESNGLTKKEFVGNIELSVTFKPVDLIILQDLDGARSNRNQVDSIRKKYSRYIYFNLNLSRGGKEISYDANGEVSDLIRTMAFDMGAHVSLTTDQHDIIPVNDFILNRTFGLSHSTDLLFAFDKEQIAGNWIQFNLKEFGLGIGNQKFRFSMTDIESMPKVNLNKTIN